LKRKVTLPASSVEVNKCKKENWKKCKKPAIKGLHSNWINSNIIASQRLSDRLIEEYNIVDQFKENHVKAIFNLQEPGEHSSCGDGIVSETIGFAYTPENLQQKGISVYPFHWKDLTNPKFSFLMKVVTTIDYHIDRSEKVLVH